MNVHCKGLNINSKFPFNISGLSNGREKTNSNW